MSAVTHHRARIASLSRDREANDPELVTARQSLRAALQAAKLEEHVRSVIDSAPQLTDEQADSLARLLKGGRS